VENEYVIRTGVKSKQET